MSNPATKSTKSTKTSKTAKAPAQAVADAPATTPVDASTAARPIAAKIADLDAAVEWFYSEDFALDQALAHYKHAAKLATSIEHDLAELKNRVEVLEDFTN